VNFGELTFNEPLNVLIPVKVGWVNKWFYKGVLAPETNRTIGFWTGEAHKMTEAILTTFLKILIQDLKC
jgi:hypothetical protein